MDVLDGKVFFDGKEYVRPRVNYVLFGSISGDLCISGGQNSCLDQSRIIYIVCEGFTLSACHECIPVVGEERELWEVSGHSSIGLMQESRISTGFLIEALI